jgi:hypothetical protein
VPRINFSGVKQFTSPKPTTSPIPKSFTNKHKTTQPTIKKEKYRQNSHLGASISAAVLVINDYISICTDSK